MPYEPLLTPKSRFVQARGLLHHLWAWGPEAADWQMAATSTPALVLLHGWMDMGASFQFMVDALSKEKPSNQRPILALDFRGFGNTLHPPTDTYWYADYLGDLDAVLELVSPGQPIDLLGHSMGGQRGHDVRRDPPLAPPQAHQPGGLWHARHPAPTGPLTVRPLARTAQVSIRPPGLPQCAGRGQPAPEKQPSPDPRPC